MQSILFSVSQKGFSVFGDFWALQNDRDESHLLAKFKVRITVRNLDRKVKDGETDQIWDFEVGLKMLASDWLLGGGEWFEWLTLAGIFILNADWLENLNNYN